MNNCKKLPDQPFYERYGKPKNKPKIILCFSVVVILLLVGCVVYIVYDKYSDYRTERDLELMRDGFNIGYNDTITEIGRIAADCQQIPIPFLNYTLNLLAIECLQPAAQE